jgi:hypothetical protein
VIFFDAPRPWDDYNIIPPAGKWGLDEITGNKYGK